MFWLYINLMFITVVYSIVPRSHWTLRLLYMRQQVRLLLLCSVIIACHTCTSYLEETLFKHKVGLTLYVQLAAYHGLVTHR